MRRPISVAEATPLRVVVVTMDTHLASATDRARTELVRDMPGLSIALHAATEWAGDATALARCRADIARADVILCAMLFMEAHYADILPDLTARAADCDAIVSIMSDGPVMRLTRLGRFRMDSAQGGALSFLKRLKGSGKDRTASAGAKQMKMLKQKNKGLDY